MKIGLFILTVALALTACKTSSNRSTLSKEEQEASFFFYNAKALNFIAQGTATQNNMDSICFYLNKAHKIKPDNTEINDYLKVYDCNK